MLRGRLRTNILLTSFLLCGAIVYVVFPLPGGVTRTKVSVANNRQDYPKEMVQDITIDGSSQKDEPSTSNAPSSEEMSANKAQRLKEDDIIYLSTLEIDNLLEAKRQDLNLDRIRTNVVENDPTGMITNVIKNLTIEQYKKWKSQQLDKDANPISKPTVTFPSPSKLKDDLVYMSPQEIDKLIKAQRDGATRQPGLDFHKIRINVTTEDADVTKVLTVHQYKQWKAEQFVKKFANPFVKSHVTPTLRPFSNTARYDPKKMIKDLTMSLASEEIDDALKIEKQRRLALGDDDLLLIPEVQLELKLHPDTITNIVHFIWFSCRKFKVHHFMSMKSALHVHSPRLILLHTDCVPDSPYFEEFVKMAGSKLKIVKRSPPTSIWGTKIKVIEHLADVARLQILLEVGGIYLDNDILLLKPLGSLLNNSVVLGREIYDALANGIILANKDSWFLRRWYQEYKTFKDSVWSYSSCFLPWILWRLFPDKVHVVSTEFLRPNWLEINLIYRELWDWTKNYAMHLYARFMQRSDGTQERSLQELAVLNTTYGEISRLVLWGDPRPHDITDWPWMTFEEQIAGQTRRLPKQAY